MNRKKTKREAIRRRAARAIQALYHNASPKFYLVDLRGITEEDAQAWFAQAAEDEIDYLNGGGAYGPHYRATLEEPRNAGQLQSTRARRYYVAKGLRAMREEQGKFALHERILDYGRLCTYGRGGRTLAPCDLMSRRRPPGPRVDAAFNDDTPIGAVVQLARIVEAFNDYTARWNSSENLQAMFDEYAAEVNAEKAAWRDRRLEKKARKMEAARPDLYAC